MGSGKDTSKAREAAQTPSSTRLLAALGRELPTVYRLVLFLGDEDMSDDEAVAWLATLAMHPRETVASGHERAWLLSTLLRLLGADAGMRRQAAGSLPALRPSAAHSGREPGISDEDMAKVDDALRELDKQTRAALLLVLQEGLSIEDAVKVQGGSRRAFTRRYAAALALLDNEVIDRLMGRAG